MAASGVAGAQESVPRVLEPVLVSVQRRAQPAQEVPLSVTVVGGRALAEAGVTGTDGIDRLAGGLAVGSASPGYLTVTIRGIADLDGGLLGSPSTAFYVDETPVAAFASQLPWLSFWDAERVEVVRGPQGTLFGEGSMGGLVRLITAKPDASALAARASLGLAQVAGGGRGSTARAMVNVPLQPDALALRATAGRQAIVGWVDVPELGARDANRGASEDARIALRWTPSPRWTVDLSHARQRLDSRDPSSTGPGVFRPSDAAPDALAPDFLSARTSRFTLDNLTVAHALDTTTLVAVLSRYARTASLRSDLTPYVPLFFGPGTVGTAEQGVQALTVDATTAELRLVSDGRERPKWTVGAFAKNETRAQRHAGIVIRLPALGLPLDETLYSTPARVRAQALFGDAEFALDRDWSVLAGVRRHEADHRTRVRFETTSAVFPGFVAGVVRDSASRSQATLPRFGLSWKPHAALHVYATRSTGLRDGDSNDQPPGHPEVPAAYGPEKVRADELGLKSQPWPWLTLNAALFRNTWSDLQLPFVTDDGLFSYLRNAGRAVATGAELEMQAQPVAGLRFALNASAVDARIRTGAGGLDGKRVPYAPRRQLQLAVARDVALPAGLQGALSAHLAHRSATESEPTNDPRLRNPAATTLRLQAGVNAPAWGARVFVDNATDAEASLKKTAGPAGGPVLTHAAPPRTLGLELNATF